jgi:hypothetical protein
MAHNDRMSSTHLFDVQDVFIHWTPDPRTRLNNELQKIYGPSAPNHIRWEVHSQGPPNSLTWYATVYSKSDFQGVKVVYTDQYVIQLMIWITATLHTAPQEVLKTVLRKRHITTWHVKGLPGDEAWLLQYICVIVFLFLFRNLATSITHTVVIQHCPY